MVNSGSFDSDGQGDRNAKVSFTQPHNASDSTQSSSPVTASVATSCKNDFSQTADSDLPSVAHAIEPTPTKTEFNSDMPVEIFTNFSVAGTQKESEKPQVSSSEEEKTSLCCSLPLEKVQGVLTPYHPATAKPDDETSKAKQPSRKLLCLYCDRSFGSANLRQKHVERVHSVKQNRRVSSRRQNHLTVTPCVYCDKLNTTENTLKDLFQHLINEHSNKYFGCLPCEDRFLTSSLLADHNASNHQSNVSPSNVAIETSTENNKTTLKPLKSEESNDDTEEDDKVPVKITRSRMKPKSDEAQNEGEEDKDKKVVLNKKAMKLKEMRNKKLSVKSSRIAMKRRESKRLQAIAKIADSQKKKRPKPGEKKLSNVNKPEQTNSTKPTEKTKSNSTCINPYPEFDHFYRVKKITDHSIDNLKISSLTFDDVFDKAFFNRIKCNIEENLLHHIDGKLFKNEESESRISNFEKVSNVPQEIQNSSSENYGCELSLNAVTPVASLSLNSQFGEDFESQIEYGSKPSKKKTQSRRDEIHYKYFTRRKYQASILEHKENRDLSKLDMWTQLVIKKRQQKMLDDKKSAKEILEYTTCDEYKNKLRREELNRVLDRRGPFEDLKEEASKKAALDKLNSASEDSISEESFTEVREVLNEILNRVFAATEDASVEIETVTEKASNSAKKTDLREVPGYLNLRRSSSLPSDGEIDKSDKIALICSSQETENFELPTNQVRGKDELIELTGEWARCRMYICAACGAKLPNMKYLLEHKSMYHQNVWVQHYEFVGNQSELYRHLSIPALGKVGKIEETVACKIWKRSEARVCTKCGKQCNSLGELHRHILECGGDWTWMLARKKCKYRPFGAKSRKKRRGLVHRIHLKRKTEPTEKKTYKKTFVGPRQRPSDADTIQRMLANLPAKRSTRKLISLQDGIYRARKNKQMNNMNQNKVKCGKVIYKSSTPKETTEKTVNATTLKPQKSNLSSNRRSLRSLNKVLSSRILDTNSKLTVKRKIKALNERLRTTNSKLEQEKTNKIRNKNIEETVTPPKLKPKIAKKEIDEPAESESTSVTRSSPRSVPKNIKKKLTMKKLLTGKINIKSFFPVKKRKNRKTITQNQNPQEVEVKNDVKTRSKRKSKEAVEPEEAEKTEVSASTESKKTKNDTFSNLVRSLSLHKKKGVKKAIQDKPSDNLNAEQVVTSTSNEETNVVLDVKDTKCKPNTTKNEQKTELKDSSKKRKLKQSFRNVINRVKKLKIDNAAENTKQVVEVPKSSSINKSTSKDSFLGERKVSGLELGQSEKIVIPSILEPEENTADVSIPAPIVMQFHQTNENPPILETVFKLESNNEKSLQAKGESDIGPLVCEDTTKGISEVNVIVNLEKVENETVLVTDDKTKPISIEISTKPKVVPLISPNIKGKIRKPARGLNDCIAMLTSKLQQKNVEDNSNKVDNIFGLLSPNSSSKTDLEATQPKAECILRIPTFKTQSVYPDIEETALDLSTKSLNNTQKIETVTNDTQDFYHLKETIHKENNIEDCLRLPHDKNSAICKKEENGVKNLKKEKIKMCDPSNSMDKIIEEVVLNKSPNKQVVVEPKWNTVDDIIQKVIDHQEVSCEKLVDDIPLSKLPVKNSIDDIIEFVVGCNEKNHDVNLNVNTNNCKQEKNVTEDNTHKSETAKKTNRKIGSIRKPKKKKSTTTNLTDNENIAPKTVDSFAKHTVNSKHMVALLVGSADVNVEGNEGILNLENISDYTTKTTPKRSAIRKGKNVKNEVTENKITTDEKLSSTVENVVSGSLTNPDKGIILEIGINKDVSLEVKTKEDLANVNMLQKLSDSSSEVGKTDLNNGFTEASEIIKPKVANLNKKQSSRKVGQIRNAFRAKKVRETKCTGLSDKMLLETNVDSLLSSKEIETQPEVLPSPTFNGEIVLKNCEIKLLTSEDEPHLLENKIIILDQKSNSVLSDSDDDVPLAALVKLDEPTGTIDGKKSINLENIGEKEKGNETSSEKVQTKEDNKKSNGLKSEILKEKSGTENHNKSNHVENNIGNFNESSQSESNDAIVTTLGKRKSRSTKKKKNIGSDLSTSEKIDPVLGDGGTEENISVRDKSLDVEPKLKYTDIDSFKVEESENVVKDVYNDGDKIIKSLGAEDPSRNTKYETLPIESTPVNNIDKHFNLQKKRQKLIKNKHKSLDELPSSENISVVPESNAEEILTVNNLVKAAIEPEQNVLKIISKNRRKRSCSLKNRVKSVDSPVIDKDNTTAENKDNENLISLTEKQIDNLDIPKKSNSYIPCENEQANIEPQTDEKKSFEFHLVIAKRNEADINLNAVSTKKTAKKFVKGKKNIETDRVSNTLVEFREDHVENCASINKPSVKSKKQNKLLITPNTEELDQINTFASFGSEDGNSDGNMDKKDNIFDHTFIKPTIANNKARSRSSRKNNKETASNEIAPTNRNLEDNLTDKSSLDSADCIDSLISIRPKRRSRSLKSNIKKTVLNSSTSSLSDTSLYESTESLEKDTGLRLNSSLSDISSTDENSITAVENVLDLIKPQIVNVKIKAKKTFIRRSRSLIQKSKLNYFDKKEEEHCIVPQIDLIESGAKESIRRSLPNKTNKNVPDDITELSSAEYSIVQLGNERNSLVKKTVETFEEPHQVLLELETDKMPKGMTNLFDKNEANCFSESTLLFNETENVNTPAVESVFPDSQFKCKNLTKKRSRSLKNQPKTKNGTSLEIVINDLGRDNCSIPNNSTESLSGNDVKQSSEPQPESELANKNTTLRRSRSLQNKKASNEIANVLPGSEINGIEKYQDLKEELPVLAHSLVNNSTGNYSHTLNKIEAFLGDNGIKQSKPGPGGEKTTIKSRLLKNKKAAKRRLTKSIAMNNIKNDEQFDVDSPILTNSSLNDPTNDYSNLNESTESLSENVLEQSTELQSALQPEGKGKKTAVRRSRSTKNKKAANKIPETLTNSACEVSSIMNCIKSNQELEGDLPMLNNSTSDSCVILNKHAESICANAVDESTEQPSDSELQVNKTSITSTPLKNKKSAKNVAKLLTISTCVVANKINDNETSQDLSKDLKVLTDSLLKDSTNDFSNMLNKNTECTKESALKQSTKSEPKGKKINLRRSRSLKNKKKSVENATNVLTESDYVSNTINESNQNTTSEEKIGRLTDLDSLLELEPRPVAFTNKKVRKVKEKTKGTYKPSVSDSNGNDSIEEKSIESSTGLCQQLSDLEKPVKRSLKNKLSSNNESNISTDSSLLEDSGFGLSNSSNDYSATELVDNSLLESQYNFQSEILELETGKPGAKRSKSIRRKKAGNKISAGDSLDENPTVKVAKIEQNVLEPFNKRTTGKKSGNSKCKDLSITNIVMGTLRLKNDSKETEDSEDLDILEKHLENDSIKDKFEVSPKNKAKHLQISTSSEKLNDEKLESINVQPEIKNKKANKRTKKHKGTDKVDAVNTLTIPLPVTESTHKDTSESSKCCFELTINIESNTEISEQVKMQTTSKSKNDALVETENLLEGFNILQYSGTLSNETDNFLTKPDKTTNFIDPSAKVEMDTKKRSRSLKKAPILDNVEECIMSPELNSLPAEINLDTKCDGANFTENVPDLEVVNIKSNRRSRSVQHKPIVDTLLNDSVSLNGPNLHANNTILDLIEPTTKSKRCARGRSKSAKKGVIAPEFEDATICAKETNIFEVLDIKNPSSEESNLNVISTSSSDLDNVITVSNHDLDDSKYKSKQKKRSRKNTRKSKNKGKNKSVPTGGEAHTTIITENSTNTAIEPENISISSLAKLKELETNDENFPTISKAIQNSEQLEVETINDENAPNKIIDLENDKICIEPPIKIIINKQKTRRKSKSFKKVDLKGQNDLFQDFALVIKKPKRIAPPIISFTSADIFQKDTFSIYNRVPEEPTKQMFKPIFTEANMEVSTTVGNKEIRGNMDTSEEAETPNLNISEEQTPIHLDASVEEMDMELDEIPITSSIIERDIDLFDKPVRESDKLECHNTPDKEGPNSSKKRGTGIKNKIVLEICADEIINPFEEHLITNTEEENFHDETNQRITRSKNCNDVLLFAEDLKTLSEKSNPKNISTLDVSLEKMKDMNEINLTREKYMVKQNDKKKKKVGNSPILNDISKEALGDKLFEQDTETFDYSSVTHTEEQNYSVVKSNEKNNKNKLEDTSVIKAVSDQTMRDTFNNHFTKGLQEHSTKMVQNKINRGKGKKNELAEIELKACSKPNNIDCLKIFTNQPILSSKKEDVDNIYAFTENEDIEIEKPSENAKRTKSKKITKLIPETIEHTYTNIDSLGTSASNTSKNGNETNTVCLLDDKPAQSKQEIENFDSEDFITKSCVKRNPRLNKESTNVNVQNVERESLRNPEIRENNIDNEETGRRKSVRSAKVKALEYIHEDAVADLTENDPNRFLKRNKIASVDENAILETLTTRKTNKRETKTRKILDNSDLPIVAENSLILTTLAEDLSGLEELENSIERELNSELQVETIVNQSKNKLTEEQSELSIVEPISEENLLTDNVTDPQIEKNIQELRRSRRGSRKIASYNENDLIDPLLDEIDGKRKNRKKEKLEVMGNSSLTDVKSSKKAKDLEKKLNSDELFDLLKANSTENIYIPKPQNSFLNNLDESSSRDFNDDNFDNVFENILQKSTLLVQNNLADKNKKDIDKIYEFTESPENTQQSKDVSLLETKNKTKIVLKTAISPTAQPENNTESIQIMSASETTFSIPTTPDIPEYSEDKKKTKGIKSEKRNYCEICNKSFIRIENLMKHKHTLTHIQKLSEIEAKEAERCKNEDIEISETSESILEITSDSSKVTSDQSKNALNISNILQDSNKLTEQQIVGPVTMQSSFSNNHSLKLADIINDVLNKPVMESDGEKRNNFSDIILQNNTDLQPEFRRYKSLGERKSFDSDNTVIPSEIPATPVSEPYVSKTTILEKQISLLENIIENQTGVNYIDDISVSSNNSVLENNSARESPSELSLKQDDSSNITYIRNNLNKPNANDESFLKPTQYEEISEDSINLRNYEDQKLRKTLNRDEELFLECCSLLKSGSEVSSYSNKKSHNKVLNSMGLKQCDEPEWLERKSLVQKPAYDNVDEYSDDNSRIPTPLGDSYDDDASNSNTISSNWNMNKKLPVFEDISQEKVENANKSFSFEEILNEYDGVDNQNKAGSKNNTSKFGGILSKTIKSQISSMSRMVNRKPFISDHTRKAEIHEGNKQEELSDDSTSDSKKIITKGARKVFEGLKVSIPTEELNLEEVLNCSPKSKKMEITNFQKAIEKAKLPTDNPFSLAKPARTARKSKPVKNKSQFGSNLLFKMNKKKVLSPTSTKKIDDDVIKAHDIYDFEETQDNSDVFTKPDFRTFRSMKTNENIVEPESDSESRDCMDSFGIEGQSITSSVSSSASLKKPKTPENITKKKCMIMGRIFKNAAKTKIDDIDEDIRDIPSMDNGDLVESYVANCKKIIKNEEVAKPKLSEKEINILFDQLLENKQADLENAHKTDAKTNVKLKPEVRKMEIKKKPKLKNRKRARTNSESTDDEFGINKATKKRPYRKNAKAEDNCINLEQELKECIGVASRKSQRKCTSGKQNVLMEYWSSDDSQFEALLETQRIEVKQVGKLIENLEPSENFVDVLTENTNKEENKVKQTESITPETVEKPPKPKNVEKKHVQKRKLVEKKTKSFGVGNSKTIDTVTSNRRKRAAANPLYHWSSSSEDESQDLIEVKPIRDEIEDDEDRPIQHGWIVGDSPKKLVTMLAQAKGKKTDIDCVKEQGKKRTNAVS